MLKLKTEKINKDKKVGAKIIHYHKEIEIKKKSQQKTGKF